MRFKYINVKIPYMLFVAFIFSVLAFSGCSSVDVVRSGQLENSQEGLLPEQFINSATDILCSYSFVAPKEAITLEIDIMQYGENGWSSLRLGEISIGEERIPMAQLAGNISVKTKGNGEVNVEINSSGTITYKIGKQYSGGEDKIINAGSLDKLTKIELDQELPIAIISYDNKDISIEDFNNHEILKKAGALQGVVVKFTEDML